jgi:hypothetical protein
METGASIALEKLMKSAQMVKRVLAAAILAVVWIAQPAQAATIRIDPVTQGANVGDTVTADILVDLGPNEAVGGVSLLLSFNSAILKGTGFTQDPDAKMGFALDPVSNDFGSGFGAGGASPLDLFFLSDISLPTFADLKPLQGTGFRVATVSFLALTPGLSPLTISAERAGGGLLSDALGNALLITQVGNGSVCVAGDTCVQQSPIPEPATLSLIGTGIGVLVARRRRKAARS